MVADRSAEAFPTLSEAQLARLADNFSTNPVCVGPFMFDHRVAGDNVTLIKSPYYDDRGHVFLGLFLGFALGSVGGLVLIVTGLRSRRSHIPFAPFLAAGALVAILVGSPLLDWYGG